MEENQITCPQCGLVNNVLADACVQCGIIFVKNPAMKAAAAAQDDEKRKSIEAAEAILDETQPPPEVDAPIGETVSRPDPNEDTVEIRIPRPEEIPPLDMDSSDSEAPELEEKKDKQNSEIELEDDETAIETVTAPTIADSPSSGGSRADEAAEPEAAETAEETAESSDKFQTAVDGSADADLLVYVDEKRPDQEALDRVAEEPENGSTGDAPSTESAPPQEVEANASASDTPAEADDTADKPIHMVESDVTATLRNEGRLQDEEILLESVDEVKPGKADGEQTEAQVEVPASQASSEEKSEADAQAKQESQKARNEALRVQQEALLKAEARKKEEAAQAKATALKKKKLAQAKAEALKKQKAAQAKAETLKKKKAARAKAMALKRQKANPAETDALKKQKAAQAKAEASAENVEVAAMSPGSTVKLLGLLKRYKGKAIGINYDNSAEIKEAELIDANEEFFSVMVREKKVQYSYPLKTILTIVEGEQGVETGEEDKKARFDAVIKVYPLVLF